MKKVSYSKKNSQVKTKSKIKGITTKKNITSKNLKSPREEADRQLELSRIIENLKAENENKDIRITQLLKQVKEDMGDAPEKKDENLSTSNSSIITTLQNKIQGLENALKNKNEEILKLQSQMLQIRKDKDSQVSVLKQSVEKVIHEKDSEIRRLKAIWSPQDKFTSDLTQENELKISMATKVLNASELGSGGLNQLARFGISAETTTKQASPFLKTQFKPKTPQQIDFIRKALDRNVFLKGHSADQVDQLIQYMSMKVFDAGVDIITEGEYGTHMYVLEKGQVDVFHLIGKEYSHIIDLNSGAVFGELAVLYNCKRTASVRAKTEAQVWCLERMQFQAAVKKLGQMKRSHYLQLLQTVEKLKSCSENTLMRIADCLEESTFNKGDYIIRQGDSGDIFYIIESGKVSVTQNQKRKGSEEIKEKFVCFLENGEYFGEGALLTEEKRSANVIAQSKCVTVLMLDRQAFTSFVGSLGDLAIRSPQTFAAYEKEKISEIQKLTEMQEAEMTDDMENKIQNILSKIPFNQLKVLSILGQGGFGCVKLVMVPSLPKQPFALKAIRKAKVVKTSQEQHILAEKNIMLELHSPFLGRLYRTYRDSLYIYLLMDAYLGGEMYGYLKRRGALKDGAARFSAACVLEALEYLHNKNIIYRDLKPENLMIDKQGYVKLVDFGFAKHIKQGYRTWTFCGTPEYFPPEILANLGHDFAADFWSFGILVYEMMSRTTPFIAADDMTVYQNILNGIDGVKFSHRINKSAENLIRKLCKTETRDRLGYQKGGFNDIRKQRWFQGFDWQGLRSRRIVSPFEVEIQSPTDVRNFDQYAEEGFDKEEDLRILSAADLDWELSF